jgi:molybdenum cofactor guanylyltransferase
MSHLKHDQRSVLGVILAGGDSRRMNGQDKFLMPLGDKLLLQHIIDRVRPQVNDVILNINKPFHRTEFSSLKTIPDIMANSLGPLSGVYTALSYANQKGYELVATFACDTPFVPDNFVSELMKKSDNPIVVAKSNNKRHPVMALWHVSLMEDLKISLDNGDRKLLKWVEKYSVSEVEWQEKWDPFFNINNGEDLKEAEHLYLSLKNTGLRINNNI